MSGAAYADVLLSGGLVAERIPLQEMTGSAHLELPAVPAAAGAARRFAQYVAGAQWLLSVDVESLELLVSELVTNAITACAGRPGAMVVLAMTRLVDGGVQVDVWDPAPAPTLRALRPAHSREGGRGLFLVEQLAAAWGRRPSVAGTQIWFRLAPAGMAVV
jgi:anti-sigma regulatory factor (Ser/Thr protein kinase)